MGRCIFIIIFELVFCFISMMGFCFTENVWHLFALLLHMTSAYIWVNNLFIKLFKSDL